MDAGTGRWHMEGDFGKWLWKMVSEDDICKIALEDGIQKTALKETIWKMVSSLGLFQD